MLLLKSLARRLTSHLPRRPPSVRSLPGFRNKATAAAAPIIVGSSSSSCRDHSDVKAFAPFLAVAAGLAYCGTCTDKTTVAEPDDRRPSRQGTPIDWNVVFSMSKDDDQEEEEGSSRKKTKGDEPEDADADDDDSSGNDVPSYIAEFARRDLGNSLNRHAPLGAEAQNILKSESQYPLLRAELTQAPNVPPPCNRNYPVHLVVDLMTVNKKMRVQGSKTYEFWPFAFLDQQEGKVKYGVPGPFIRGEQQLADAKK